MSRLIWFGTIWLISIAVGWVPDLKFWSTFSSSTIYSLPPSSTDSQMSAALDTLAPFLILLGASSARGWLPGSP